MDALASPAQLATRLGTATQAEADAGSPDILDTSRALDALASASGAIREACGWPISRVVGDTYSTGEWTDWTVYLPTMKLTAVTAASGLAALVAGVDFMFNERGKITLNAAALPSRPTFPGYPLTFTFTHGYSPVPDEVIDVCLELAVDRYDNPRRMLSTTRADVGDVFPRYSTPTAMKQYIRGRLTAYCRPVVA